MKSITIALLAFFLPSNVFAQKNNLSVIISGFQSSKGKCVIKLYIEGYSFYANKKSFKKVVVHIPESGTLVHTFKNIPKGKYAIITYHDKNSNGKLDTKKYIGIPIEPVGNSNNHQGRPSFKKSSFILSKDRTLSITVKRLSR